MYASSCFRSVSVNFTFSHRSLAHQSREHRLGALLLGPELGDHLAPQTLLLEPTLDQVGRPDRLVVQRRQLQVVEARLRIVLEAGHGAGQLRAALVDEGYGPGAADLAASQRRAFGSVKHSSHSKQRFSAKVEMDDAKAAYDPTRGRPIVD